MASSENSTVAAGGVQTQYENVAIEVDDRNTEDVVVEGRTTRLQAFAVWRKQNNLLFSLMLAAFLLSLAIFGLGIYSHNNINTDSVFTGLNAVPWLGALLTASTIVAFLPTHLQSSRPGNNSTLAENIWALCLGLSLILDLLSACFATANAADTTLSSRQVSISTNVAILYGVLVVELLLVMLLYLGCITMCGERHTQKMARGRKPSAQPMVSNADAEGAGSRVATFQRTSEAPSSLNLTSGVSNEFANAPPATGGSAGGAITSRARPSSQVFDTGSPMSINAPL